MARKKRKIDHATIKARCIYTRVHLMKCSAEEVAELMGYKNTSQVSKMERSTSKTGVNLDYLSRLSDVSGVSLDFLYGKSDFPERDPRSVEQMAMYNSAKDFAHIFFQKLGDKLLNVVETQSLIFKLENLNGISQEVIAAVNRIIELNPEFEDEVRGGAKLFQALEGMKKEVAHNKRYLDVVKHDINALKQFESVLQEAEEVGQMQLRGI